MNDARVNKAFLQNFRILLKNLLKKLDAEVIVMVCLFENWACYLFRMKYWRKICILVTYPWAKRWLLEKKLNKITETVFAEICFYAYMVSSFIFDSKEKKNVRGPLLADQGLA